MPEELTLEELIEKNRREQRYKILSIPDEVVLSLLYPLCDANILHKIKLPDDVRVVTVWFRPERASFEFLLESETFVPVPDGEYVPEIMDARQVVVMRYQLMENIND